jgi:hypothetical protein
LEFRVVETNHALDDVVGNSVHDCINLEPGIQRLVLRLVDASHLLVPNAPEFVVGFAILPVHLIEVKAAHPIQHPALQVGASLLGCPQGIVILQVGSICCISLASIFGLGGLADRTEGSFFVIVSVLMGVCADPAAARKDGPGLVVVSWPFDNSWAPADHISMPSLEGRLTVGADGVLANPRPSAFPHCHPCRLRTLAAT